LASPDVSLPPDPGAATLSPSVRRRQRLKLLLLLGVCASPVIASYLMFYVFMPSGRTNYGELIEPRPAPALQLVSVAGEPATLQAMRGRWLLLHVDGGACPTDCAEKLYTIRQLRAMTGKERTRIEPVWLVTDDAAIDSRILEAYDGTRMLRVDRSALTDWLPPGDGARIEDHLFMVDPLGNLMMRYARDGEPRRIHKDIGRLLKASRVG
jgi:hypothetical protein